MPERKALLHLRRALDDDSTGWMTIEHAITATLQDIDMRPRDYPSGVGDAFMQWALGEESPLGSWLTASARIAAGLYSDGLRREDPGAWVTCLAAAREETRALVSEGEDDESWLRWNIAWAVKTVATQRVDGEMNALLDAKALTTMALRSIQEAATGCGRGPVRTGYGQRTAGAAGRRTGWSTHELKAHLLARTKACREI